MVLPAADLSGRGGFDWSGEMSAYGPFRNDDAPEPSAFDEWLAQAPFPLYESDERKIRAIYTENTQKDCDE
jgi:hypothetical protein